ncbi:15637_t:CDS:2 [Dentiscutata heterogama]|uniref:15637_t:CDS:1 n=1 Tax=Dentiscutata heterogama TaxID=1316150 RepID=A0ACA9MUA4_9GLOM|nr:15637_t:CDS:2 [Dentiscutata heterogama]
MAFRQYIEFAHLSNIDKNSIKKDILNKIKADEIDTKKSIYKVFIFYQKPGDCYKNGISIRDKNEAYIDLNEAFKYYQRSSDIVCTNRMYKVECDSRVKTNEYKMSIYN